MKAGYGVVADMWQHREEAQISYGRAVQQPTYSGVLHGTENSKRRSTVRTADGQKLVEGAPIAMESWSDTTWSMIAPDATTLDTLALALTANGGLVFLTLKNAGVVVGSSAELEGLGVYKLSDKTVYGRLVFGRMGGDISLPTPLLCDARHRRRCARPRARPRQRG